MDTLSRNGRVDALSRKGEGTEVAAVYDRPNLPGFIHPTPHTAKHVSRLRLLFIVLSPDTGEGNVKGKTAKGRAGIL